MVAVLLDFIISAAVFGVLAVGLFISLFFPLYPELSPRSGSHGGEGILLILLAFLAFLLAISVTIVRAIHRACQARWLGPVGYGYVGGLLFFAVPIVVGYKEPAIWLCLYVVLGFVSALLLMTLYVGRRLLTWR